MPKNTSKNTLKLLDMQGRILKTVQPNDHEESVIIETSNLISGIYIVELISQQTHQSKQIFLLSGK
jgi:hypothetical protein